MIIHSQHFKVLRDASRREKQGKPITAGEMKPLWRTLAAVAAAVVLVLGGLTLIAVLCT